MSSERTFQSVNDAVRAYLESAKVPADVIQKVLAFLWTFSGENLEALEKLRAERLQKENESQGWKIAEGVITAVVLNYIRPSVGGGSGAISAPAGVARRLLLSDFHQMLDGPLVAKFAENPFQRTSYAYKEMRERSRGQACVVFDDDNKTVNQNATVQRLVAIQQEKPVDSFVGGRRVYCVGERPNERVLIDPIYGDELTDTGKGRFEIPWGEVSEEGQRFVRYLVVAKVIWPSTLDRAAVVTIWTQVKAGLQNLSMLYGGEAVLADFRDALADGSAPQVFSTRERVRKGQKASGLAQTSQGLERAVSGSPNY